MISDYFFITINHQAKMKGSLFLFIILKSYKAALSSEQVVNQWRGLITVKLKE